MKKALLLTALVVLAASCDQLPIFSTKNGPVSPEKVELGANSSTLTFTIDTDQKWDASLFKGEWTKIILKDSLLNAVVVNVKNCNTVGNRSDTLYVTLPDKVCKVPIDQNGKETLLSESLIELVGTEPSMLRISTTSAWSTSFKDGNWIEMNILESNAEGANIAFAAKNEFIDCGQRNSTLNVTIGADLFTVDFFQKQTDTIFVDKTDINLDYKSQIFSVKLSHNVDFSSEVSADWISKTSTKALMQSSAQFSALANYEDEDRSAQITFTSQDGSITHVVNVNQSSRVAPFLGLPCGIYQEDGTEILGSKGYQLSRYRKDGSTSFRFLKPQENFFVSLSGIPFSMKTSDSFSLKLAGTQNFGLASTHNVTVGKVEDSKAYLFSDKGIVFIVKF